MAHLQRQRALHAPPDVFRSVDSDRTSFGDPCANGGETARVMIIEEIYDALIEAGASEGKARAMTNYETRISKIESDLNLLKWMVGFNLALTVAVLFRVFS
jgi:hypothetical protein